MFYHKDYSANPATALECYEYFTTDYFQFGYFVNGPPEVFQLSYVAGAAVIDLDTFILEINSDVNGAYLSAAEIMVHVNQANE